MTPECSKRCVRFVRNKKSPTASEKSDLFLGQPHHFATPFRSFWCHNCSQSRYSSKSTPCRSNWSLPVTRRSLQQRSIVSPSRLRLLLFRQLRSFLSNFVLESGFENKFKFVIDFRGNKGELIKFFYF